jgi:hypothetical protein
LKQLKYKYELARARKGYDTGQLAQIPTSCLLQPPSCNKWESSPPNAD